MNSSRSSEQVSRLSTRLASAPELALDLGPPLAPRTTFKIGGPAEVLVRVATESALVRLLDVAAELRIEHRVLGLGSNLLVPDEGLTGVTIVLEGEFLSTEVSGTRVVAGAALPLARVARSTVERGLAGLEALAGFPSTVGGAVVMNAGCYGVEIKDVLVSATVVRPGGFRGLVQVEDLDAGYRSTNLLRSDAVVSSATFALRRDEAGEAATRLAELNRRRRQSMPSGRPNAGSVFKNPKDDFAGRLIEACGLKGRRLGGAGISPEHANVIVNQEGALASDVLGLMIEMHDSVLQQFGVSLRPELILAGSLGDRWRCHLESLR
jgi:UDP-N-acetylmuramate dehydrogenase